MQGQKNMYKCSTSLIDRETSVLARGLLFSWQHFVLKLEAEKCLMHVLKRGGLLFRTLIPFAVMMCIAVSAVCICIFMFFYDSSAYWTKRPFRTVRHWQALPFTFTILLACIVRWARQTAEMWFSLKPMYDFNLIQQPQKKKKKDSEPKRALLSILFPLISYFFCFYKPLPLFLVFFLPLSLPSFILPWFPLHPLPCRILPVSLEKWLYLS